MVEPQNNLGHKARSMRENEVLVSVIIPAYKARNYLADSLASVANQNFPRIEVILIDDFSPEPIDDIIDEYLENKAAPPLSVLRHELNQGLGASRNTGIRAARGEWIAFLDHDDLWAQDHISSLLETALNKKADTAYCSVKQFQIDPKDEMAVWGPEKEDLGPDFPMALLSRSFITPSATLVRRQLLLDLDGFNTDPRVHMCEDLDLWLRMLKVGARFSHSNKITCYYRKHADAATSRPGYMAFQSAYVRQLHAKTVPAPWITKRSLVAASWWTAWITFLQTDVLRWDVLTRAIWQGLPVPWEIVRGLVRTIRCLKRRPAPSIPTEFRP